MSGSHWGRAQKWLRAWSDPLGNYLVDVLLVNSAGRPSFSSSDCSRRAARALGLRLDTCEVSLAAVFSAQHSESAFCIPGYSVKLEQEPLNHLLNWLNCHFASNSLKNTPPRQGPGGPGPRPGMQTPRGRDMFSKLFENMFMLTLPWQKCRRPGFRRPRPGHRTQTPSEVLFKNSLNINCCSSKVENRNFKKFAISAFRNIENY